MWGEVTMKSNILQIAITKSAQLIAVHGELLFRQRQAAEIVRGNEIATENC